MAGAADSKPAGEAGARPPQRAARGTRGKVDGRAGGQSTGKGKPAGTDTRPQPTVRRWVPVGRVRSVHVYPVKSAGAPPADAITLDAHGAVGDRWFLVTDLEGAVVTVAEAPELRSVVALLAMDGAPVLDVPGAATALRGSRADAELSGLLGRGVRIVPAVRTAERLEAPVHVVSTQSVDAARRGEHQAADCACSLEEPRANLVLDLHGSYAAKPGKSGGTAYEALLLGRTVRVGEAEIAMHRPPEHCLGIYADVVTPGTVRPGDPVEVLAILDALEAEGLQPEALRGAPPGTQARQASPAG